MASEKVTAMIEEVKALTVLELSELVHALEEEFGVSAAAMAAPAAGGAAPAAEEKTEFDVVLTGFDAAAKIKVIKVVREITGQGLAEAKATVEGDSFCAISNTIHTQNTIILTFCSFTKISPTWHTSMCFFTDVDFFPESAQG